VAGAIQVAIVVIQVLECPGIIGFEILRSDSHKVFERLCSRHRPLDVNVRKRQEVPAKSREGEIMQDVSSTADMQRVGATIQRGCSTLESGLSFDLNSIDVCLEVG